jgi:hypothetical protein
MQQHICIIMYIIIYKCMLCKTNNCKMDILCTKKVILNGPLMWLKKNI